MSVILQFFDRPAAIDVRSALAACQLDLDQSSSARAAAMFDQFLREVQFHYPLQAGANGVDQPLIWAEGLPLGPVAAGLLNLALDAEALDDTVLSTLGHVAADAGLQMLEPQGGVLYRLDRQVVHGDGSMEPFSARSLRMEPFTFSTGRFSTTKTPHTLDVLCDALMEQLAPLGFEVQSHPTNEHSRQVQRRYGPTVQAYVVQVQPEFDRQYLHCTVRWWLPTVREAWLARMDELGGPELRGRIDPHIPDFEVMVRTLAEMPGGYFSQPLTHTEIRSQQDLDTFANALALWARTCASPLQDTPRDIASLGRYLLRVDQLNRILKDGETGVHGLFYLQEQMALLVLALQCSTPLQEVWLAALRHRQRTTQHVQWMPVSGTDGNALFDAILNSLTERPPVLGA